MNPETVRGLVAVLALSVLGVGGDWCLKVASTKPTVDPPWFAGGVLAYTLSAFGWVYVLRRLKLATVGVYYCISTVLLLTLLGAVVYRETLRGPEIAGILAAIAALVLLGRFAG